MSERGACILTRAPLKGAGEPRAYTLGPLLPRAGTVCKCRTRLGSPTASNQRVGCLVIMWVYRMYSIRAVELQKV